MPPYVFMAWSLRKCGNNFTPFPTISHGAALVQKLVVVEMLSNSSYCMDPEVSSPCTQQPVSQFTPLHSIHFNIILSFFFPAFRKWYLACV